MGVVSIAISYQMEKETATHSSVLAWRIPWTEEPGGLYAVHQVARVRHDLETKSAALQRTKQETSLIVSTQHHKVKATRHQTAGMAGCSTGGIPARLDTQPKSCVVKRTRGSQRASSAHQKRERRVPTLCLQSKSWEGHGSPELHVRSEQAQRDAVAGLQPVGSRRQAEKKTSRKALHTFGNQCQKVAT